ncbi:GatB/YqeY domain-containing protein [Aliiglaciecola sp.]|nr:GatB/YqeY domain-containing protein [Aliiglaciecola sp.]|mmetsp:Transcript_29891/g.38386  ORF Transcript_29891/g.38386 Transcript_29891/m.38386 type:complete len:148 (+) Transcript_29891:344-787(+)|eukprot:CAMPEP_0184462080 /NCGR_PEP_ID=MMETSP0740-20130409/46774_1 /TAXON_ID=385413 /ORGANISM="Thalassiosira miniscula, Strain CCMP1093" /LENGTH=147 /DNA_ID=CAMNT_0026835883 /DNA_START=342 /DNA_END=785 /DNA_ORIENTATION=+
MTLLEELKNAMKEAMRAKEKLRLGTIRMALAAVKQKEVDERVEVTDSDVIALLTKMVKQRKDAAQQFEQAGRNDLMETELAEIDILSGFLPQALSASELDDLIQQALTDTQAAGMQDMGKVMAWLKPKVQGRADMGKLSGQIKAKLG